MSNVTKKDIVAELANKLGTHDVNFVKNVVQSFLELVRDNLARGQRMEFRDFGIFELVPRKAKKGRNITKKMEVEIPAQSVVKFTPGKELAEKAKAYGVAHPEFLK
jgi:integration host factor subunit beta